MGYCKNCLYFTRDNIFFARCGLTDREVQAYGSCSHFYPYNNNDDYTPSGSGCFLTSACAEYLGKPDDCEELTKLRAFRDGYMKKSESGRALVEEYYKTAPEIVRKIESSGKKDEYYSYINSVVNECIADIDAGRNDAALDKYVAMVKCLGEKLLQIAEE